MQIKDRKTSTDSTDNLTRVAVALLIVVMLLPLDLFAQSSHPHALRPDNHRVAQANPSIELPDSIPVSSAAAVPAEVVEDMIISRGDTLRFVPVDTVDVVTTDSIPAFKAELPEWEERSVVFNPNPTRAVWLSALFPGLGQIYNRRYWKLPIIVGGYLGLGYATNWNNNMLRDYTRAYSDLLDNDPSTNSYMDFFPATTSESDLDKTWLQNLLKSRKDYFRRNRDLCIICMVGVYFLAMIDAYVDASLSHFDISPDLTMDVAPAIIQDSRNSRLPSIGLQWAITF